MVKGTALTALPPHSTIATWTTKVSTTMKINIQLLKNPAKTFRSFAPSLRALI
jgi:hypothetical protein